MFQSWQQQLFMHWQVPASVLRPLVPAQLEIDDFNGATYIGLTPFHLTGLRYRFLPPLPVGSDFPEVNLRTYVRFAGKPGVFFFSLDAASRLAVFAARATYHLPYYFAKMSISRQRENVEYRSRRVSARAELVMRYHPIGQSFTVPPGSLDHFLIERYALYVVSRRGNVLRGDIHHRPWRLRNAIADIERNTIPAAHGFETPARRPLVHYSERQDTVLWGLTAAD